jgi:cytochrome c oxidase cbb3-type subunit 4
MDIATLRIIITVVAFLSFLAIVAWAWSGARRARFEEAAWLPFEDGERKARDDRSGATLK